MELPVMQFTLALCHFFHLKPNILPTMFENIINVCFSHSAIEVQMFSVSFSLYAFRQQM